MIELKNDGLVFSFPEVHGKASLKVTFERTLRIPDDGNDYPLPPGLGEFPLRHVDDFERRVPGTWIEHGGVMLPMYQAEALWIYFDALKSYPMAVKIAAGKINAVSGRKWRAGLHRGPQDYVVVPDQPWLDGYCVEKGFIRQFVAAPLGSGYSAEEQVTGKAEHGGLQIAVYPMKADAYEKLMKKQRALPREETFLCCAAAAPDMGLALGGRMRQEIYDDPYGLDEWELEHGTRCFVHICNSDSWKTITGEAPPTRPFSARDYTRAGLPWFEYYDESQKARKGSKALAGLKSVAKISKKKRDGFLDENEPLRPEAVVKLRKGMRRNQIREFREE